MEHLARKLWRSYKISLRQAYNLVAAGYTSPKEIAAASDAALLEVEGIGPAAVQLLRRR